jgi:hypothetical protein
VFCSDYITKEGVIMILSEKERFDKYVKEQCKNCKNREKDLCEIHTSAYGGIITTKCEFYEKEEI